MSVRLILLALLIAVVAALWWTTRAQPLEVSLHEVGTGPVRATVSNTRVGTVETCDRAYLSPAAAGQVAKLYVEEGDQVAANTILLEIWNEDRKAEIQLADAELRAAQARVAEACATAAGAEREAARLQRLSKRQLVSEEEVDRAVTESESRQSACEAAVATTRVSSARINVARQALERTRLRAPFDGVVAEIDVRLGEYLTPSPPGIATLPAIDLINAGCMYVSAPIDEVDAPAIRVDMPACVTLDAFANKRCSGRVRRIAPYVLDREKQARTVEVEVELVDTDDLTGLLPGYSADIEVLIDEREDVLRIPTEALVEGESVLVYEADSGRLVSRPVDIGLENWEFTEIRAGLTAGERIVLATGREGVEPGAAVVPAP